MASPQMITTPPLLWRKSDDLFKTGTAIRASWEWLRVLKTSGSGDAGAGGDYGGGTVATVTCRLEATGGSGLVWEPEEFKMGEMPAPGTTVLIYHQVDDPTVWAIVDNYGWRPRTPPNDVPRGWGGGDQRSWVPWLAEQRAAFEAGPRVVARVADYNKRGGTRKHDTDIYQLTLDIAGVLQQWEGRLGYVNDKLLEVDHEITVAVGPDGKITAFDTDERYVSEYGQCLVISTAKKDQHLAEGLVQTQALRLPAHLARLRKAIGKLDGKRGKGWRKISEEEYSAAVKELVEDALYQQEFDHATAVQIMTEAGLPSVEVSAE
jgi:hypothetical protein